MSDEVAPECFGDDALAGSGQVLRRTVLARSVHATACPASDGVAGAVRGLVVADALVPDAANHLAGKVVDLGCSGKPTSGVPEKLSFSSWMSSVVISTRRFTSIVSSSIRLTSWPRASARASSVTMDFRRSTIGCSMAEGLRWGRPYRARAQPGPPGVIVAQTVLRHPNRDPTKVVASNTMLPKMRR